MGLTRRSLLKLFGATTAVVITPFRERPDTSGLTRTSKWSPGLDSLDLYYEVTDPNHKILHRQACKFVRQADSTTYLAKDVVFTAKYDCTVAHLTICLWLMPFFGMDRYKYISQYIEPTFLRKNCTITIQSPSFTLMADMPPKEL